MQVKFEQAKGQRSAGGTIKVMSGGIARSHNLRKFEHGVDERAR